MSNVSEKRYRELLAHEKAHLESLEMVNSLREKLDVVKRRYAEALAEIKRLKRERF